MSQSDQAGRTIEFRISGVGVPKDRVRHRIVTPKGKRPFVQVYTPKETRDYEDRVKALAAAKWGDRHPSLRPIELQVSIYVEIPPGWPKWKREAAARGEVAPTGTPDTDNVVKTVQDGMNGVVYRDDSQVIAIDAVKLFTPADCPGFVEVVVRENWRSGSWITRIADFVMLR